MTQFFALINRSLDEDVSDVTQSDSLNMPHSQRGSVTFIGTDTDKKLNRTKVRKRTFGFCHELDSMFLRYSLTMVLVTIYRSFAIPHIASRSP